MVSYYSLRKRRGVNSITEDAMYKRMPEPLWNSADVADYLGVTREVVQAKSRKGELPHVKIGGRWLRYEPETIRALVQLGSL